MGGRGCKLPTRYGRTNVRMKTHKNKYYNLNDYSHY